MQDMQKYPNVMWLVAEFSSGWEITEKYFSTVFCETTNLFIPCIPVVAKNPLELTFVFQTLGQIILY